MKFSWRYDRKTSSRPITIGLKVDGERVATVQALPGVGWFYFDDPENLSHPVSSLDECKAQCLDYVREKLAPQPILKSLDLPGLSYGPQRKEA